MQDYELLLRPKKTLKKRKEMHESIFEAIARRDGED